MREVLVESPGTAPGSEPPIMGAFIAIVRIAPDKVNIGAAAGPRNGNAQNPDLIFSNSSTSRSRSAASIGVWKKTGAFG